MLKRRLPRLLAALLVVAVLVIGAFAAFAWRTAIAPIAPPAAASFAAAQVEQGRILAAAGNCVACHHGSAGALAGGYPLKTGFGTIYSPNITSDADTGIGRWSLAAFTRAMHEGVARDGSHLFPALPYDHFTKVSDADVAAIYAWLMTQPAVRAVSPANTIPFPLNIRALQAGWKMLYFHPGRFVANPAKSAEWNRGAYLAEGIAHCGGCHTPRGALGAEKPDVAYAGAALNGWIAPPLTAANPAPVAWTAAALATYLRIGSEPQHGSAAGDMSGVVHVGMAALPDSDVRAIATYIADGNASATRSAGDAAALARAAAVVTSTTDPDARLYATACGSCHYAGGKPPSDARPDLALNTALWLDAPDNFIQVVLHGIGVHDGAPGVMMPGYGRGFSDADIARIAAYLRRTRTTLAPWHDVPGRIADIRKQSDSAS